MDMDQLLNPYFLKTFRKAYEVQNFTQTSKILGMTQSGVSQHMASLEEVLKATLFERIGKKVFPTPVADQLYAYSGVYFDHMENFISKVQSGENAIAGQVSMGAPGSFWRFFLSTYGEMAKKTS